MPILTNPQHELMAQGLAQGKSQERAYIEAGYSFKGASGAACKMCKANTSIGKRVAEILNKREDIATKAAGGAIKVAQLTLESHLAMMAELRDEARAAGKYESAIIAEKNRGLAAGFYIQRVEAGPPGAFSNRTEEEIQDEIATEVAAIQAERAIKKAQSA